MNTITLFGQLANKVSEFRHELNELSKDWESTYSFDFMFLNNDVIQINIKSKDDYQSRFVLLLDCEKIIESLEQWTEFRCARIDID